MSWLEQVFSGRTAAVVLFVLAAGLGVATGGSKDDSITVTESYDFGDAPEGVVAYPDEGVVGMFPTCVSEGPSSWIQHSSQGRMYFGGKVDVEADGNGGNCSSSSGLYNGDETFGDGDAGLLKPRAYTIKSEWGSQTVTAITFSGLESIGNACLTASWGTTIDIQVNNMNAGGKTAYVNVLFDWNHDGVWGGSSWCGDTEVPEHVLVNFPIPSGYQGMLSNLGPSDFGIGPLDGYVWVRFSITDRQVGRDWNGDGVFLDGETEDYLLHVKEGLTFCTWDTDDAHAMHWAQLPDTQATGIDVDLAGASLAEDFVAAQNGPVTQIHFWGSFKDDKWPKLGVDSMEFEINIYANRPATSSTSWDTPGELLWTGHVEPFRYDVGEITSNVDEGWYEPTTALYGAANHKRVYQYNICFDEDDDRFSMRLGTTYWVEIVAVPSDDTTYQFGWKTSKRDLQTGAKAVWYNSTLGWRAMNYPVGHPSAGKAMDLSLVVVGTPQKDMDFGDAPNTTYPTRLASNGARHIIVSGVYLGRSVDGESDGQPNANATGDDLADTDDEDGVVFLTALVQGQPASVQVTASRQGALNAWIDWNGDGDWDDSGEQVATDVSLSAGVNTLSIEVPARATVGKTFARFRFSTIRGLRYNGLASDGEVEDYQVEVQESFVALPPLENVKWSQPPVESDPTLQTPVFCGWGQPAYVSKTSQSATGLWYLAADNFQCIGDMPVTFVSWWGSYQRWTDAAAPSAKPASWRIGFWSNVPADGRCEFGRPGELLWVVSASASRVQEERAGCCEFPEESSDTVFRYVLNFASDECFPQDRYVDRTEDRVFWISITAVYTGVSEPQYPWAWTTRPQPWSDGAVKAEYRAADLRAGLTLDSATVQPIENSLLRGDVEAYDLAFELGTDPSYIKWEQAFTGLRDWPYYEDEQSLATGKTTLTARRTVADDWRCTTSQPIAGFAWWGSYLGYGYLPCEDGQMAAPRQPDYFLLSLWSDVPDPDASNPKDFGKPGRKLWEYQASDFEEVLVGFDKDPSPTSSSVRGFEPVYRYTVRLPEKNWYRQDGQNNVLWLSVVAVYKNSKTIVYPWGWTNHAYAAWGLNGLTPVGHWKLDETEGTVASDSSGNGNNGTVYGNPVWRSAGGWLAGALEFDGRGDYVKVERPTGLNFAPASFSVSAWIYPHVTTGQYRGIVEYDRDSLNGNRFGLWLDSQGRVHFRVGQNTWQSVNSVKANQWCHVAGVFDTATQAMKIYVDGVLGATATHQKGYTSPTQATLVIGARGSMDDEYFDGLIDDVRVYKAALTADEMLVLAGAGRNESAVVTTAANPGSSATWTRLLDPAGVIEDMSFQIFTSPATTVTVGEKSDDSTKTETKVEEKK
jgi:hypothetical protein